MSYCLRRQKNCLNHTDRQTQVVLKRQSFYAVKQKILLFDSLEKRPENRRKSDPLSEGRKLASVFPNVSKSLTRSHQATARY